MPRAGLTTLIVVCEAADLADEIGYDALTLTAVASRLDVAVPSLYKHVAGLDDLRRRVALMAVEELGAVLHTAIHESEVMRRHAGQAGDKHEPESDIHALATAYRRYALDHPGRYAATVRAAPAGDDELRAASAATLRTVFDVLRANGLRDDDVVHAARSLRAALHGFASLETAGGFGLPQDVERSFEWMVEAFEAGLTKQSARH
jgi:AcrR family transcriptional regulator